MPASTVLSRPTAGFMLPRMKPANAAIGIALSLLLHGLAALWWWNMTPTGAGLTAHALHTLEVRLLRELPPAAPPALAPAVAPKITQNKNLPQPTARPLRTAPSAHAATPTTPPQTAATPALPASPVAAEKRLDLAAVHASLAAIVAEDDREKGETPVGQLQAKPLYRPDDDNRVGKAIRSTTRPDCKNNIANTGLLAPLFLLAMAADKKDSGCKW